MNKKQGLRRVAFYSPLSMGIAAFLGISLAPTNALAIQFSSETYDGSIDTTISYGISSRQEDQDDRIIGIPNGGEAYSVNSDDGNLNFDEGTVSNTIKLTSELELNFDTWGLFLRGSAFYDAEIMDEDREHVDLTNEAEDLVGRDAQLLDAYVWSQFEVGENAAEVRFGNQVLSWGESTFIQNSINTINPLDVSKIRVPGAELREALTPIPILSASIDLSENSSLEAFYQLEWQETVIDPPGSYFSTNDFVGDGGERVQLGFGGAPEGDFLGVSRGDDDEAGDSGQWGLAFRLFAPNLGDTEFGFYYINYHSRLPVISANAGTNTGLAAAGAVYANAGVAPGADPTVDALATDAFAQTASYFIEYPEDINLFGISFNTEIGNSGVALQGEISHRQDVPLQVDDVELLFAALSPLNPAFANFGQLGAQDAGEEISGVVERDVTQVQFTATSVFPQILGASQLALVGEVGWMHVNNMPDKDDLRLNGSGTFISGNEDLAAAHGPAAGTYEAAKHFADADSWGYRLLMRMSYDNAIGSVNLKPRIAFADDVQGISPGPGGNFLEGRQAVTIGLSADFLNQWSGDLSYTEYSGAGRYNLINDRDFAAFNLKFAF